MDKIYQGKSGTSYMQGELLASGGEGSVYTIRGCEESVLKVFKSDRRTLIREEKLLKMVEYRLNKRQLDQVTWPQDVIYDQSGFVGYIMPRLQDNQNLNKVYATQDNTLNLRHRMLIAYNLCAAIDTVHSLNQVCGDLNPQNICVNLNLQSNKAFHVTLVDTDSYHIIDQNQTYRCEVGLANYLAPEIQKKLTDGRDLKTAPLPTFTKETDLFALAVHIFSLIMNGCHPFACAKKTNSGYQHTMEAMNDTAYESVVLPQPIDNIKNGFFPFHEERKDVTYPLYAPSFDMLPEQFRNMFILAFEEGYHNPGKRPTTKKWLQVLKEYLAVDCYKKCNNNHLFFCKNTDECPYCNAQKRMLQVMSGTYSKKESEIPNKQTDTVAKQTSGYTNTSNRTKDQQTCYSNNIGRQPAKFESDWDRFAAQCRVKQAVIFLMAAIIFLIVSFKLGVEPYLEDSNTTIPEELTTEVITTEAVSEMKDETVEVTTDETTEQIMDVTEDATTEETPLAEDTIEDYDEEYAIYANAKWGYRVLIPNSFLESEDDSDTGDGVWFGNNNGELYVFGYANIDAYTPKDLEEDYYSIYDVTYCHTGDNYCCVSYVDYDGDQPMIDYEACKIDKDSNSIYGFHIHYPETDKELYDDVIQDMLDYLIAE